MEHNLELTQKQAQALIITQQMEQSIRILEMDAVELQEHIQSVAMENPAIDIDEIGAQSPAQLKKKKMEWLEQQAVKDKQYVGYYDPDSDSSFEKTVAAPQDESLTEHLLKHLSLSREEIPLKAAVEHLIGFLDDDGYLRAGEQELTEDGRFTKAQIGQALTVLQTLDPPGVGARNLAECLLLQLPPEETLARSIVAGHMDLLAKNQVGRAAKVLDVSCSDVEHAFGIIRGLNPKPGGAFSPPSPSLYVTPDVLVTSFQDRYYVLPCEFSYPTIRMSGHMQELMQTTDDPEVTQYLSQKMKQAEWIQKCIASRSETLLSVARAIVQHQIRFFRFGPQYLSVLRMSDIAAELDMHESTVSRAVKNKYLQCMHGTYPLRHFFVLGASSGSDNEDASAHAVKHRIKELVDGEDKSAPLSDQKLADLLKAEGTAVSRRTVAKYRDLMGIPNSAHRR